MAPARMTSHDAGRKALEAEGLMLLASIEQQLRRPGEAIVALDRILNNSEATEDQKSLAQEQKNDCVILQRCLFDGRHS